VLFCRNHDEDVQGASDSAHIVSVYEHDGGTSIAGAQLANIQQELSLRVTQGLDIVAAGFAAVRDALEVSSTAVSKNVEHATKSLVGGEAAEAAKWATRQVANVAESVAGKGEKLMEDITDARRDKAQQLESELKCHAYDYQYTLEFDTEVKPSLEDHHFPDTIIFRREANGRCTVSGVKLEQIKTNDPQLEADRALLREQVSIGS
jgi:hypothetical protein